MTAESKDIIVLDLETKRGFEVFDQRQIHKMGVSVVGVYSYNRNQYRAFREEEFPELLELFRQTKLVVGFNSISFDFVALQPYFTDFDLKTLEHLDMLNEVVFALGHRLKLESIAQATLGRGKTGSGLDAIRYYNNCDWDNLIKYCLDDVKVTKEVYDYGLNHGHIWYTNAGQKEKIIARWANNTASTVADTVTQALKNGDQLEIEYMGEDGVVTNRQIDIQSISGDKVKAFCHLRQALRFFDVTKIRKAKVVGKMTSFQKTLL